MAFENDTNRGRVLKILDVLALIEKSAESNRATPEALAAMLRPLTDHLGRTSPGDTGAAPAPAAEAVAPLTAGQRAALALADKASLRELIAALVGRLDAHRARLDEAVFAGTDAGVPKA